MGFFDNLFKKKQDKVEEIKELEVKLVAQNQGEEDSDEVAAVIAAVVAAMDEEEETVAAITAAIAVILGKSTSEFIVRNIKRTPEMDSIWAQVGRMKLMG